MPLFRSCCLTASHVFVATTLSVRSYKDRGELTQAIFPCLTGDTQTPLPMEELNPLPQEKRMTKEFVKRFRATADEVKKIEEKAKKAGLNFSEYCRQAALDKQLTEYMPAELRLEVLKLGNNLNQLARIANTGKLPGAGIAELNEIVERLLATLR